MSTATCSERSSTTQLSERVEPNREENKSRWKAFKSTWKDLTRCEKIKFVVKATLIALIILTSLVVVPMGIVSFVGSLVASPIITVSITCGALLIALFFAWLMPKCFNFCIGAKVH